jgi:hypothetical protein
MAETCDPAKSMQVVLQNLITQVASQEPWYSQGCNFVAIGQKLANIGHILLAESSRPASVYCKLVQDPQRRVYIDDLGRVRLTKDFGAVSCIKDDFLTPNQLTQFGQDLIAIGNQVKTNSENNSKDGRRTTNHANNKR